ncbi:MAG: chorismate mutase [candidate division KSB1 bacterium]|nr:chorismate mutase [candidate division KSB1 bacterium]
MSLKKYRSDIDQIDQKLLELLNSRADIAQKIGREKSRADMPVVNQKREQDILHRMVGLNPGPLKDRDIIDIYKQIIAACREIQN